MPYKVDFDIINHKKVDNIIKNKANKEKLKGNLMSAVSYWFSQVNKIK